MFCSQFVLYASMLHRVDLGQADAALGLVCLNKVEANYIKGNSDNNNKNILNNMKMLH